MYEVNTFMDKKLKMYELKDTEYGSSARVAPERGGIITAFNVNGHEILYMDEETLHNPDMAVSGGNPILFPICGVLTDGQYEYRGKKYSMGIHGVIRDYPWEVVESGTAGSAYIKIIFRSSEKTRVSYPFDFEVIYTYSLEKGTLTIDQEYKNLSDAPMPFYIGFHPYFNVSDKARIKYGISSTEYYNYNDSIIRPYTGEMDMTNESDSKIFIDVKGAMSFYDENSSSGINMEFSSEFKYAVLWSIVGRDFICLEPWTAKPDSMNTKEDLYILNPGESYRPVLKFRYV